ncbi:MAG: PilZ domain-containing protein [Candidatus Eremiobacteraeota bacterium]|nr:PilZ domain-containing protein [Candidatus Eremiobacteraeota bacterium]
MDFLSKITGKLPEQKIKEKRFVDRRHCSIDVTLLKDGKERIPAVIKDIAVYGLGMECSKPFRKDEQVDIIVPKDKGVFSKFRFSQDTVKARVVWTRKKKNVEIYAAGVRFADSRINLRDSWVFGLLGLYGFQVKYSEQRRKVIRYPTSIKVKYIEPRGYYNGWGTLVDLSLGGLSMLTHEEIQKQVVLDFELGPSHKLPILYLRGTITWNGYSKRDKTPIEGVEFVKLNAAQEKLLHKYMMDIVEELAQK